MKTFLKNRSLSILFFLFSTTLFADWQDLNTGINDELTSVAFWGNNGIVAGKKGIYYTTNGGSGPVSWTRFDYTSNTADSLVYNHTQFYSIASETAMPNVGFLCGYDTVSNSAVVFKFDVSLLTGTLVLNFPSLLRLRDIAFSASGNNIFAVGDGGMAIVSPASGSGFMNINLSSVANFKCIKSISNQIIVVGDEIVVHGTENGNTLIGITTYFNSGSFLKSFDYDVTANGNLYSVTTEYCAMSNYTSSPGEILNYDFGPLDPSWIYSSWSGNYITTDHGIYLTAGHNSPGNSNLEFQTTSSGYNLNKIWFSSNSGTTGYAVGKNGTVLTTTNNGYPSKPNAYLSLTGGCVPYNTTISGNAGTANVCKWYLNGSLNSTNCGSFTHNFTTAGTYTVSYVLKNSSTGLSDSASSLMYVVTPAQTNLPLSLSDSLLCKAEAVTLLIGNSELNWNYNLIWTAPIINVGSVAGNGSLASLLTGIITDKGPYTLKAISSLAPGCSVIFPNPIYLNIEKTTAKFHSDLINAGVNEAVNFYQRCTDAQNYLWDFGSTASQTNSGLANVLGNTFSVVGIPDVKLICWSNQGCYDTIVENVTRVYQEPLTEDSCWVFKNTYVVPSPATGGYNDYDGITRVVESKQDGFFISGTYNHSYFHSRYADSLVMPTNESGGCVTYYSSNGVLKWFINVKRPNSTDPKPVITAVINDDSDNVYITGSAILNTYFHLNDGDSVQILKPVGDVSGSVHRTFIMKLNSRGKLIWISYLGNVFNPKKLRLDHSGNVILLGTTAGLILYMVNNVTYTLATASPSGFHVLMKFSNSGLPIWNTTYYTQGTPDFSFDANDNLYVVGGGVPNCYFNSVNNAVPTFTVNFPTSIGFAVAKYNSAGVCQWNFSGKSPNSSNQTGSPSIVTDSLGNCYILATANISIPGSYSLISAGGSTTSFTGTTFLAAKISPTGDYLWSNGISNSPISHATLKARLFLRKNVVTCVIAAYSSIFPQNLTFTSANGNNLVVPNSCDDFIFFQYDTAGNILSIKKSGNNICPPSQLQISAMDIFVDSAGFIYFFGKGEHNYTHIFNDFYSVPMNNFGDADLILTKGGLGDCGVTINAVTTSLSEIKADKIILFPNPAQDYITLISSSDESKDITVFNILGQKEIILKEVKDKNVKLNTSHLSNGVHFIIVNGEGIRFESKFIKE